MRILWHAPHPDMPTGYANQTALWVPRLAAAGHEVAVSCTAGIVRHNTTWQGHKVYGRSPYTDMAEDLVRFHYEDFGADLVITLCCPWKLHAQIWQPLRTIHLMPVDCDPLGRFDRALLGGGGGMDVSGAMPAAVSRFGERVLREAGFEPLYLPHGVDTNTWQPPRNRRQLRQAMGVDHLFVIGMNASNTDPADRKGFNEAFRGFAAFHGEHPLSVLAIHAAAMAPDGLNLLALAQHLGIADSVMFSDQYPVASAGATTEAMAAWYGALDVLLAPSHAEGFNVPLAEAQACGTPVITTAWSTGPELAGPGWMVEGQARWNDTHHADWHAAHITSVAEQLGNALRGCSMERRRRARRFATANLDADRLFTDHWEPVLKELS